ncbi:MAG TPA: PAS domain S-box protein [Vicinamibacterales bacterium]|nr:PAS domain S-box protein [Vicinamibacterales bacterium]
MDSSSPQTLPSPGPIVVRQLDAESFRLLVEHTVDYAIFMLDTDGYVRSWNAGAERIKGYAAHEIIGRHFSTFYPPEAIERNWPAQELEIARERGRLEDEGWRLHKNGSRFWANVIITAIRNEAGELIGFGKVSRDLTERREGEQRLRESEERFRLLVDSTTDYAIFMLDTEGRVASWNPGAQRIKGYAAEEIIGRHFSTFYTQPDIDRKYPDFELREAARVGRWEDEGLRVRKDGSTFWANVVISAVRGADGELRGFGKVTRDISQRRAHEERIERLTRELEERVAELAAANRELAQKSAENESFVYSVSHDLRSPLVNLQGFSQELVTSAATLRTLLTDPSVPSAIQQRALALLGGEFDESVTFIRNAVQHLGNIIDGLLRLSRVGRVEYQFEVVDVNAVLADLLSAMHTSVVAAGGRIVVRRLPVIRADRNALAQVFANLIGNALKSFDEGRPGVLEISATDEALPVFTVRDNGVGIPAEYHNKIFQVFQHVHSSPSRGEGMGLAIVRRIVDRHGGRIWFESSAGAGTAFHFTLGPQVSAAPPGEESKS